MSGESKTERDARSRGALRRWLRAPDLTRRQWRVLGVLGAANLIDSYDQAVTGLALKQIQAGLAVPEEALGSMIATIRLGVVPAILLTLLADRIGRRRLLLFTILGFTLSTFLTAFVQSADQFMLVQFVARAFIAGEGMLAVVVIVEEFDARTRGWGIGVLGAMGALGHGLAAIIFAAVDLLPYGWRALYVLGVGPLLLLAWFRRSLEETRRFEDHRAGRTREEDWRGVLEPLRNLIRMYPGRIVALCAALFPVSFMFETALFFVPKHLQEVHGYKPAHVAVLFLTMGVVAPIGNVVAGQLGDLFGRKRVILFGLLGNLLAVAAFYNLDGWLVPPAWALMVLTVTMVLVLFSALGGELFPTSYRSTASGVRAIVATLGASSGLLVKDLLYGWTGTHAAAITWMLLAAPLAPVVIAFFLPETARHELEEISPEKTVMRS